MTEQPESRIMHIAPGDGDPIRVLIVDDHALFRRGLEMVLEQEPDIEVVGEASDGAEALTKAVDATPDIVLLDVRMPKRGGIDACTAIKDAVPSTKIIMLTISDEEADLYDAIKAGAMGYLLKEISIEEVASAIRAVHGGQSLISPSMASKLLTEFASMIKRGDERRLVAAPPPRDPKRSESPPPPGRDCPATATARFSCRTKRGKKPQPPRAWRKRGPPRKGEPSAAPAAGSWIS